MSTAQLDLFSDACPSAASEMPDAGSSPAVSGTRGGTPPTDGDASRPALHDASPTARTSDPGTSKDYDRGDPGRSKQCARVLNAIAAKGNHGATCADVVAMLCSDRGNTSRRITDLTRRGLVEATGPTRATPAGRRQLVHYVTREGLEALPAARRLLGRLS